MNNATQFQVSDFGPIVDARVDLKPLTIFVGPSNTGKSYLAILIYALHRVFSSLTDESMFRLPWLTYEKLNSRKQLRRDLKTISDIASYFIENPSKNGSISLDSVQAKLIQETLNWASQAFSAEVARCFGVSDTKNLMRRGRTNQTRVVLTVINQASSKIIEHGFSISPDETNHITVPANQPILVDQSEMSNRLIFLANDIFEMSKGYQERDSKSIFSLVRSIEVISSALLPSIMNTTVLPAYYMPADRTGIMHAHSVVVKSLISSAATAGIHAQNTTDLLTGVLADFLEKLVGMASRRRPELKNSSRVAQEIEESILNGRISITADPLSNYPRFSYRPEGWVDDLTLSNASSMVSELAPVVLYLKHVIRGDSVLIIEEPEAHLHPAMQVDLIRQLASLIKVGIRVILTTHSEWLLEELANIVGRAEKSKPIRKKDSQSDICLDSNQVGVWLFETKKRPKGTMVKEVKLDDSGLFETGYSEISQSLHNEWVSGQRSRLS